MNDVYINLSKTKKWFKNWNIYVGFLIMIGSIAQITSSTTVMGFRISIVILTLAILLLIFTFVLEYTGKTPANRKFIRINGDAIIYKISRFGKAKSIAWNDITTLQINKAVVKIDFQQDLVELFDFNDTSEANLKMITESLVGIAKERGINVV